MTDRERYKRTFSVLHAPAELNLEVTEMRTIRRHIPKVTAICAAAVIAATMGTVGAYAADVGGIQRKVQIWIEGDRTDAVLEIEPCVDENGMEITEDGVTQYSVTYEESNGKTHERHGGGVAFDDNGKKVALSEEDIVEHLNEPEVIYNDDGTIFVFCKDQVIDITDKFDEDDMCYVTINGDPVTYMSIKKNDGYAMSNEKYPDYNG